MTTTQPSNSSEWQLYRVLQRSNLLQYYDTFVAQGGDDVPQLCEAGEEEFLEIMALVGMASKPLHVRRLQKALQEWVANPAAFQGNGTSATVLREPPTQVLSLSGEASTSMSTAWNGQTTPLKSVSPISMLTSTPRSNDLQPEFFQGQLKKLGLSGSCTPALSEEQISGIAESAARLIKGLPAFEPKALSQKKEINKQIYEIINLPVEFTKERLELMRKYGAIYRRFDSERAYSKPMSLHEVCVNESAAQLCYHMPNLLTRREDLFPLSRQVVKESGYQYSKGHSRSTDFNPENPSKRQKLDNLYQDGRSESPLNISAQEREIRQERLQQISKDLASVSEKQEEFVSALENAREGHDSEKVDTLQAQLEQITNKHLQLLTEQSDLLRKQSMDVYIDFDGASDREDSNIGASGSSSPAQTDRAESSQHNTLKAMLTTGTFPKSSLNSLSLLTGFNFSQPGMKNSLFDEGLRIAQQYGLGDFAQELKTLQGNSPKHEQGGEDEEETGFIPSENACSEQNGGSNDSDSGSHLEEGSDKEDVREGPNSMDDNERKTIQRAVSPLVVKINEPTGSPLVKIDEPNS